MHWIPMAEDRAAQACSLYNQAIASGDMIYKPLDQETFCRLFVSPQEDVRKVSLIAQDGGAFAAGCYVPGQDKAYITMVVVRPDRRRTGMGRDALLALEHELSAVSQQAVKKHEILFFNPVNLEWIVPGSDGHDHPNGPGVDMSSMAYLFFKNCGYRDFACQNSYYIDLTSYRLPDNIQALVQRLTDNGISITRYDAGRHTGMQALLEDLDNPLWSKLIPQELERPDGGRPILIAEHQGVACAFTGPLDVQPSGRGYFAGIGVHSQYRGCGVAKVLFSSLCSGLKDIGASYMTLFTGETNPARNIYEAAGFKIVRSWSNMRKAIK